MLLQARPSLVSSITKDGNTCAHIAALKGRDGVMTGTMDVIAPINFDKIIDNK